MSTYGTVASGSDDKQPLFAAPSEAPAQEPIYQERTQTRTMKYILGVFLAFVVFNLVLSTILVSVQAALVNGLFALLLISLLSFAQVEGFVVFFIYKDHLKRSYFWAIFVIGIAVVFEAIATDIIVFTVPNEAKTNS